MVPIQNYNDSSYVSSKRAGAVLPLKKLLERDLQNSKNLSSKNGVRPLPTMKESVDRLPPIDDDSNNMNGTRSRECQEYVFLSKSANGRMWKNKNKVK